MDIPALLLQFGGSLVAILVLFGIAKALRLGGVRKFTDESSVRIAAGEVEDGFEVHRFAIAKGGRAALASDCRGQIMIIKQHGNQFAGRVLTSAAQVSEEVDAIIIDSGEARFGTVRLSLDQPGIWVDAINRL